MSYEHLDITIGLIKHWNMNALSTNYNASPKVSQIHKRDEHAFY